MFDQKNYNEKRQQENNDVEDIKLKINKNKMNQIQLRQMNENFLFGDWITIEKQNDYAIGHLGNQGLILDIIKGNKELKNFGFFEIVKMQKQGGSIVKYSSKFYLLHVQTGLYLSSVNNENHRDAFFDHVTLKTNKQQACLFMFKKRAKGSLKNNRKSTGTYQQSVQLAMLNFESECVQINSDVRIMNWVSGKYLQVVKTQEKLNQNEAIQLTNQQNTWKSKAQSQKSNTKSKQRLSNFSKQQYNGFIYDGINTIEEKKRQVQENMRKDSSNSMKNNIWLSSTFDLFTVKLQRRSRPYNPVLLSNYDVVLIYNQFTNCYITLNKRKPLVLLQNRSPYSNEYSPVLISQTNSEEKSTEYIPSFPINLNSNYFSSKNCFVEQIPDQMFQNNDILSYMWKVFTIPFKNSSKVNKSNYPSLIKSNQIVFFQHLETGLFLIKNQSQNESTDQYVLRQNFQEPENDQKSQKNTFMFRVQNLTALKHDKEFIFNEGFPILPKQQISDNLTSKNFQPINTSFQVTLDFEEQQFVLSKIRSYPRIHYFTIHFPQFLKSLISFLNNPKAIDDRIQQLKQKLAVTEIIYDKIFCKGFIEIVKEMDKGYYFLQKTVTILKIIRLKMKQYELQALNIKSNRQNSLLNKKKQSQNQRNKNKNKEFNPYREHYIFANLNDPIEELFQLNAAIFTVLKPLIDKILKYLSLVFGSQSRQIFDLIEEKQINQDIVKISKKRPSQNLAQIPKNQNVIVKKKNSAIMSSSLAKKRMRNSSISSSKSNSSSISENLFMTKDNQNLKSAFASRYNHNETKECTSQLLKELIKSLVHLFQIEPQGCSQILKLLSVQQPYQIIGQLNERLQKLDSKVTQLEEKGSQNRYAGHESNPNFSTSTTLKIYKYLESHLFQEMCHCMKLINHIIEYFNEDIEYDWSKRLRYIESKVDFQLPKVKDTKIIYKKGLNKKISKKYDIGQQKQNSDEGNFELKLLHSKQTKVQTQQQNVKKDGQIAIHYRKRWYKFSDILFKTQSTNFKKLLTTVKQNRKIKYEQRHKKNYQSPPNNQKKLKSQVQIEKEKKSRKSLIKQTQKHIQKNHSQKSNSQKYLLVNQKNFQLGKRNEKTPNSQIIVQKQKSNEVKFTEKRKKFMVVEEDKNYLFEFLKHTMKLMMINLKSTSLPVSEMLSFFEGGMNESNEKNPFHFYSNLSSLAFVLQMINNIDVALINGLSSTQSMINVNISLLNNSRFICCDHQPITQHTNLYKILNFRPQIIDLSQNQTNLNDYPLFLKQENISFLIERSPFCVQFYQEIFNLQLQKSKQQTSKKSNQKSLFIESISGLKTFFISLEIFVSIGQLTFAMLKKIQNYVLRISQIIVRKRCELNPNFKGKNISQFSEQRINNVNSQERAEKDEEQKEENEIISGVKDTIESLLVEISQLFEIIYIQKKRITRYPFIQDSANFFSTNYFVEQYQKLVEFSPYLINQIPIITSLFKLNLSLCHSTSLFSSQQLNSKNQTNSSSKSLEHRFPIQCQKFYPPHKILNSSIRNQQLNSALLTWPYLSLDQIQIFYPQEIELQSLAFKKTSETIIKLNQLTLMLNTLESMEENQKVKNHLLIEIRSKISAVSNNLHSLPKLQASKKLFNSFGLIEIVLNIILNNKILEKVSIRPFLEFLIEIKMWKATFKDFYRVLVKGGMINYFSSPSQDNDSSIQNSVSFLTKNMRKQQFFIIIAKYLQQIESQTDKLLIVQILTSNLMEKIQYIQDQNYQSLMQKMTFLYLLIEKSQCEQIKQKILNKLMNRQDVQLYIEALKTFKNFQYFCQNLKNIQILLQNKRLIHQKNNYQTFSSDNLTQTRSPKNSSIFNFSNNLGSHGKVNKITTDFSGEKEEMTTFKKQEITKFVIMTSMIFKIYNSSKKSLNYYLSNFVSSRKILKILRSKVSVYGNSYQLFKPLLIYLESNETIFQEKIQRDCFLTLSFSNINLKQTVNKQNQITEYLNSFNQILSHYSSYINELKTYQSTSSFFLPFIEEDQNGSLQPHLEINKEKVKKITSQLKNFSKKTYFWELLLWNPCYYKEQGILVIIQKILLSNLDLFVWKTPSNKRNRQKTQIQDILEKLQTPLNRALHNIFDNILSIDSIVQNLKELRYIRIQTRIKKLRRIFTEIFPTIQASLLNLKSLKLKQMKQNQEHPQTNVIQEQEEDSFGFLSSDDKYVKSRDSSFDRQQSFQSVNRKMKNIKLTKRVINEPKTLEVKRGDNKKDKQNEGDEKFNAEMIGYHLVTKLWSHQKLQRFIKVFEEEQIRRQIEQQKLRTKTKISLKDQMLSEPKKKKSNQMFEEIGDYLDDQSEDYVIDQVHKKNTKQKSLFPKKLHFQPYQDTKEQIKLHKKKSKSELSQLQSLSESANYSHHAMIVAQNSLNQDTPARKLQSFNQQSYFQSRVTAKSKQKGLKNLFTSPAFQSINTLKNLKRSDYSNFYDRLKSYQFYEVVVLLKKVLFQTSQFKKEQSLSKKQKSIEVENEFYYEVEKLFLQFFGLKATVSSLFFHIQNYLKLQSQKAGQKQHDIKFCFQTWGVVGYVQEGNQEDRMLIRGVEKHYQDTDMKTLTKSKADNQIIRQSLGTGLNPKILVSLFNRQNHKLIQKLIDNHTRFHINQNQACIFNECNQQEQRRLKTKQQLKQFLYLLSLFLQTDKKTYTNRSLLSQKQQQIQLGEQNRQIKRRNINYVNSQTSLKSEEKSIKSISKNINSSASFSLNKKEKSSLSVEQEKDLFDSQVSFNILVELRQFFLTKRRKVSIICGVIKLLNCRLSMSNPKQLLDFSIQNQSLLNKVQQNLIRFIYELVWDFNLVNDLIDKNKFEKGTINQITQNLLTAIDRNRFQIKLKLVEFLSEIVSFLSIGKQRQGVQQSEYSLNLNRNLQNTIIQLIRFSLTQSYRKLVINPYLAKKNNYQLKDNAEIRTGSIGLLKGYFKSMSDVIKNDSLQKDIFIKSTSQFTYQMILGTIDQSFKKDLTSSNIQSLQFISLLTSCLTFLQMFISSTQSANILIDKATNQTILVFYQQNNKQIHNGWFKFDLVFKLLQFQIFLYNLLFKNQTDYFSYCTHNTYLKQMMKFSQKQTNPNQTQDLFDYQKEKGKKYLTLLNLLIETINIFHNLSFKFSSFPSFQTDLFKQRKLFIQNHQTIKINIDNLKDMYAHLNEIFRCVVLSPEKSQGKNQLKVFTFPIIKEFQFVIKFSLLRLFQQFLNEKQRKNLIFDISKVYLSFDFNFRKINSYIVKWSSLCQSISQVIVILLMIINLFLGGLAWTMVLNYVLLTINSVLLIVLVTDKLTSTLIMFSILKVNQKLSLLNILTIMLLVFSPLIATLIANFYSFWQTRAIPFMFFIFLLNKLEKLYTSWGQYRQKVKYVFIFLFTSMLTIFAFQIFTRLGFDIGLPENENFTESKTPLFSIGELPFNFLNLVFQFPKNEYITKPFIILFYIWFSFIKILAVALIIVTIVDQINFNEKMNSEKDKFFECNLCFQNAQSILQQQIKKAEKDLKKQKETSKQQRYSQNRLKWYVFDKSKYLNKFLKVNQNSADQFQKQQAMQEIILNHIKQRHNLFQYISYFCYLLDKKQTFLSEKEKKIKERIEHNDSQLYI